MQMISIHKRLRAWLRTQNC